MLDITNIDLIIHEKETFCGTMKSSGGISITYQPKDYDYAITTKISPEVAELIITSCKKEAIEHFMTVREKNL